METKRNAKGDGWFIVNADKTVTNKKKYTSADGKVFCKSFRGKNKTDAKRKRELWEHENSIEDHPLIVSTMPVAKYMLYWLDTFKKNAVSESTYDSIEDCIEARVNGYPLAQYQLSQLTLPLLQSHVNALVEAGYSRATIVKTCNILNNCFKKAVSVGDMRFNPMVGIDMPSERRVKTKAKKIQFYPPDDIEKIYSEALKRFSNGALVYHHGPALVLMMYTGIRIGECLGLKWGSVDFSKGRIIISNAIIRVKNRDEDATTKTLYKDSAPKTETSNRVVPLSDRAIEALWELYTLGVGHNSSEDYVVQSELHNRASERNIRRTLHLLEEHTSTSVQGAGLHVLRHTFASYAIYRGMDIITLSKILGHARPSVTSDVYVDIIDQQKVDAIKLLN